MKIKIVRNDRPNEDGRWLDIPGDLPTTRGWLDTADALEQFVPEGHHLVAMDRDEAR